jgi:hypothetical protein
MNRCSGAFLVVWIVLPVQCLATKTFDWLAFERALIAYRTTPSQLAADGVRATLPSTHVSYDDSAAEKSALRTLDELLASLLDSIRSRDRVAAALGFDLLLITDGGQLEDIYAALSELIALDPALFLQELELRSQGAKNAFYQRVPESLVPFMGERFVDREAAVRCRELTAREQALLAVTAMNLAEVRDRCLKILARAIADDCPTKR